MEKFSIIKVIAEKQLDQVKRIDRVIFPADKAVDLRGATWWLVLQNKEVVGFAGLAVTPHYGFLRRCGVIRTVRSNGLHKKLIRVRLRHLKRLGALMSITYTSYENRRSANNLLACGFRLYEPQSEYGTKHALYFMYRF